MLILEEEACSQIQKEDIDSYTIEEATLFGPMEGSMWKIVIIIHGVINSINKLENMLLRMHITHFFSI